MGSESKGVGPYPARITKLQNAARPVTVPKESKEPAKILQFEKRSRDDAAIVNTPALKRDGVERVPIEEGEVEKLLETLPRRLAEAMVNGNTDPLAVHNLDPTRVMDLLEE